LVYFLLDYTLKRSKRRKTVAIKVAQQQLTVYAPHFVPLGDIESWLVSKKDWVQAQIAKQASQAQMQQLPLETGVINLFNQPLAIKLNKGKSSHWQQNERSSELSLSVSSRVKNTESKYLSLLEDFLHHKLESYLEMRIHDYCLKMQEALPEQLKVQHYKRRWGSCNQRRELTFNLHLACAPTWVIDYVIVHELAHLKYMNHSSVFWQRVSRFYPDYKKASQWLKVNGSQLRWQ
tara:strand:+ start:260 stop:961 length:702 start_codon:yes stop_codon:yes gene_type:complete